MDEATLRVARRGQSRKRNRTIAIAGGIAVVIAAVVVGALVLSIGSPDSTRRRTTAATSNARDQGGTSPSAKSPPTAPGRRLP